jgi:hypothetical protein
MNDDTLDSRVQRLVAMARAAGCDAAASDLESAANGVYTTGSEYLGEMGLALTRFRKATRGKLSEEADRLLHECLAVVGKAWPKFRWPKWLSWPTR